MFKQIAIIDIDGVINPFYGRQTPALTQHTLEDGKDIFFNKEIIQELTAIFTEKNITWVWGSAWKNPQTLNKPLNINFSETIKISGYENVEPTWKLPFIRNYIENNPEVNKIIWLDDEIIEDGFTYMDELSADTLTIAPDRNIGIDEKIIKQVKEFLS